MVELLTDAQKIQLISINGKIYKCITIFKSKWNKLMSSDTGRSAETGEMGGTLKGVFPTIAVTFDPSDFVTKADLIALLQLARQNMNMTVRYYDVTAQDFKTMNCYCDDLELSVTNNTVEPFTLTFIANKKVVY